MYTFKIEYNRTQKAYEVEFYKLPDLGAVRGMGEGGGAREYKTMQEAYEVAATLRPEKRFLPWYVGKVHDYS